MAEEIDFEKCIFRNFRGPVTLTLIWVIRHTVMHHSSTSMYIPNFIELGHTFCGRTYGRTYPLTDGHFPPLMLLGRLGGVDLKMGDGGGGHCLVQIEWHPVRWSVCPTTVNIYIHTYIHTNLYSAKIVKRIWGAGTGWLGGKRGET